MSFIGLLIIVVGFVISCADAFQIRTTEALPIITAICFSAAAICVEINQINRKNNKRDK